MHAEPHSVTSVTIIIIIITTIIIIKLAIVCYKTSAGASQKY
jgi:hypothetical protein